MSKTILSSIFTRDVGEPLMCTSKAWQHCKICQPNCQYGVRALNELLSERLCFRKYYRDVGLQTRKFLWTVPAVCHQPAKRENAHISGRGPQNSASVQNTELFIPQGNNLDTTRITSFVCMCISGVREWFLAESGMFAVFAEFGRQLRVPQRMLQFGNHVV